MLTMAGNAVTTACYKLDFSLNNYSEYPSPGKPVDSAI